MLKCERCGGWIHDEEYHVCSGCGRMSTAPPSSTVDVGDRIKVSGSKSREFDMQGFKSRKFLAGIACALVVGLLVKFGGVDSTAAVAVVSPVLVWILSESYIDGKSAGNPGK